MMQSIHPSDKKKKKKKFSQVHKKIYFNQPIFFLKKKSQILHKCTKKSILTNQFF